MVKTSDHTHGTILPQKIIESTHYWSIYYGKESR